MSKSLDDLAPSMRTTVFELIARATEANVPVAIINVLRTEEEQIAHIKAGVSWTANSKHLPQPDFGNLSLAIDLCPYALFTLHGANKLQWDANDPAWQTLGKIGESLNLRWGGRWKIPDMGHFEYQGG